MHLNILAFAVPVFIGFMLIEYWIARRQGKQYFNFADTVSNLNVGIAERLADVFLAGAFYFVYDWLYQHYAIWHVEATWYNWILLLLATDFMWYWYHRFGHEVNLFWAFHVVHHQSPEYNFSAGVRVTIFQAVVRTGFWTILPVLGFPAPMITSMLIFHGLYPFFTHTRLVGKLGWLEYILVTPSHHRVHHASNEEYLDKNYGDVFIFWDKLFGTFKEEKAEPVYGLTKPLNSYSFLWQHFHFLLEMVYAFRRAKGFKAKWNTIFGGPEHLDPNVRGILERKLSIHQGKHQKPSPGLKHYVQYQMLGVLLLLFVFILLEHYIGFWGKVGIAGVILSTLINCGAILEQRRWVFHVEWVRACTAILPLLDYGHPYVAATLFGGMLLFGLTYFQHLQQRYLQILYRSS